MFPLGLRCVLDLATIYVSLGLHYFPVTFSHDFVDICFMFPFHYSLCFPHAHYVFSSLSRTPQFPLNPILLYFAYTTQISYPSPTPAHPLVSIYISCTCTLELQNSLGTNTDLLIRQMLNKLWENGKHTKPLFTQQMVIFFRIYWAHLPTIYWVQQMSGFFTICWITWSSFPYWVNLEKNQGNLITIYWAIRLKGFLGIYLISLFTIYWASKFWVFSQFTGSHDHNLLIR